jgi:hypothetical protein
MATGSTFAIIASNDNHQHTVAFIYGRQGRLVTVSIAPERITVP